MAGVVQAAVRDARVTVQETFRALPVAFSPLVIDAVERAATKHRYGHLRLPSGAFHDAQFVVPVSSDRDDLRALPQRDQPQPGGVRRAVAQLAAGTRVLTQVLAELGNG